ncbi:MAG: hypothetical protein ACYS8Z_03870 [Planctomycetota bacterium]|jgi:hypothetical protein
MNEPERMFCDTFMREELIRLLDHLERILDPVRQNRISGLFSRTLSYQPVERPPLVLTHPRPIDFPFRLYPFSQACDSPEKMLNNELTHGFDSSIACRDLLEDDLPCTIRANFGTVVMASVFGARIEHVEDSPPWVRPAESDNVYKRILDCDPCDFTKGLCPKVVETYDFYRTVLAEYPILRQCIRVVLPDLQGPFDTAEQLRGSSIYEDLYRDSEMLFRVMHHIAEAQVGFAKHLRPYLNDGPEGYSHQHNAMICGNMLIRNDCAINISPEMYRNQVLPHDSFVLESLNGGGIHCCGRCEHLIKEFLTIPAVKCIDLGQPDLNDVKAIYGKARRHKIPIIRMRVSDKELLNERVLNNFPTGVTLVFHADSLAEARRIIEAYKKTAENNEAR